METPIRSSSFLAIVVPREWWFRRARLTSERSRSAVPHGRGCSARRAGWTPDGSGKSALLAAEQRSEDAADDFPSYRRADSPRRALRDSLDDAVLAPAARNEPSERILEGIGPAAGGRRRARRRGC